MKELLSSKSILQDAYEYQAESITKGARAVLNKFGSNSLRNKYLCHRQYGSTGKFVATSEKWKSVFNRDVKLGARPIYISAKGRPQFVYDYSETEGEELPHIDELKPIICPFINKDGFTTEEYDDFLKNVSLNGIDYIEKELSYDIGGYSCLRKDTEFGTRYGIVVNANYDSYSKTAIIFHELAHIFIAQQERIDSSGSKNEYLLEELKAELVTCLVCSRLNFSIENSIKYLSNFLKDVNKDNVLDVINDEELHKVSSMILDMVHI